MGTSRVNALNSVDLNISKGEFTAVMGPSGSGKSTLMNIIGCLDTPTSGDYYLNNKNISRYSDNDLAEVRNKEIGFIFQTFNLLPRTSVFHNVELPLRYSDTPKEQRKTLVENIVKEVNLFDRINHKPNELSGGQRQRVAIARALVSNPSIVLADEPTGNLDSSSGKEIMDILKTIHQKGNTLILVTHDEKIANYADRIIYILDGKISRDFLTS